MFFEVSKFSPWEKLELCGTSLYFLLQFSLWFFQVTNCRGERDQVVRASHTLGQACRGTAAPQGRLGEGNPGPKLCYLLHALNQPVQLPDPLVLLL